MCLMHACFTFWSGPFTRVQMLKSGPLSAKVIIPRFLPFAHCSHTAGTVNQVYLLPFIWQRLSRYWDGLAVCAALTVFMVLKLWNFSSLKSILKVQITLLGWNIFCCYFSSDRFPAPQ